MKRSLTLCFVIFIALTLVVMGCSGSGTGSNTSTPASNSGGETNNTSGGSSDLSDDKVIINIRTSWNELSLGRMKEVVAEFNELHPHIEARLEFVTGESAVQKLRAEFVSGNPPEIVQVFKKHLNDYIDSDLLLELTPFYEEAGWLDGYFNSGALRWETSLVGATSDDPKVYGVADFLQPSVIYYNVGIFRDLGLEEPSNIDELIEVSKKIKEAGISPLVLNAAENNVVDILAKAQAQFAGVQHIIDINEGKAKFTDGPMVQAAKAIERLIKEGVIDPISSGLDQTAAISMIGNGQAAMYSLHSSIMPNFEAIKGENPDFEYDVFKELDFTDNPVAKYSATFGGSWVIPKTNQHVEESFEFLKFAFNIENAQKVAEGAGKMSNVLDANYGFTNPVVNKIAENMIPHVTVDSFYLIDMVPAKVLDALRAGMQEMINGTITAEEMMENAQRAMDEVLAER